ncbi:manganese superoxide dismutase [Multifurca ochricompacta]|uniref:Superoxide dismutase n=1 Tax=Multifurca ochricompacta TaxID=376703 RepID=A0AAD4LWX0_9AGAM|nr:manganese superoxide dismutase [Multifurca ochricompacta]
MLSLTLTRSIFRPTLARSLALRAATLHTLPDLPYSYDALEPHISAEIMELHHSKHHQAYVNGLNAAEESYVKAPSTRDRIALQAALKFNGGGHINHSLFWKNLAPVKEGGGKLKDGKFKAALERTLGSGWGWLGYNSKTKKLEIVTTSNQDPLLTHEPIIGVDIWEHAFYLQYLTSIWNVINFEEAEARFTEVA